MAPEKEHLYDPVVPIPTYDEAVAGTSRSAFEAEWTPVDHADHHDEAEGHSLLTSRPATSSASSSSARRPDGYRPPTVETDDEDDLCGSLSDSDADSEAAEVRREMQEMEIVDADADADHRSRNLSSIWGKRIGFALSLPQWRWRWRWRLPRMRIRLGEDRGGGRGGGAGAAEETPRRSWWPAMSLPSINGTGSLIIFGRMLAVVLLVGFLYLLFLSDLFANMARRMGSQMFDPESVRVHVQSMVDPSRIREKMEQLTGYAHVAGTAGDYTLATGIKNDFIEYGLEGVKVDKYYVYLNYPTAAGRAVEILGPDGKPTWSAAVEEPNVGSQTTGNQTLAFHAHSKSGDAKGPLIYANYGSREDFKMLLDKGIDTKGAIALVRQGGPYGDVGSKVKAAELAGFAGCITYTDPADDGFVKGRTAPDGRWLPGDAVQRGSASLTSMILGDPLTPGWESENNLPRLTPDKSPALVNIPSLPLSWKDAQPLLQHIKGYGQPTPKEWVGGVPDVGEWWIGNLSSPVVHLKNEQEELQEKAIWNVYGRIVGMEQSYKSIIIGNHRDSLTFGATGPHSGTAVMLEVVRIFGDLVARGWRPLRTIQFMSWDAGEYNLIGSTEYVEKHIDSLREDAFAYINLDTAVTGDTFHAAGSPVFRKLVLQILNRVSDPYQNTTLRDLFDRRGGQMEGLGAGSDYAAFQAIAGTSSLDLRFEGGGHPHGSNYDTFEWMNTVGDPGFVYHTLLGQVVSLLVVELADRPIVPFDMTSYADALRGYVDELEEWARGKKKGGGRKLNVAALRAAANDAASAVRRFNRWEMSWENSVVAANRWESAGLGKRRGEYNNRMAKFETDLLDLEAGGGIPNRTQFKHVVFGPQLWSPRDVSLFPAVRDAVLAGDWDLADKTVEKVARIIAAAARALVEEGKEE
ncbi:Zn-dependent exopeptidase [Phialemonium atrogriseum]|uniref:Zn-dependent exopeptidase n=1 Tax=Phialemonium atrogriseum TaxID=1093897 RepID=A0AAJ0FPI7_9PEZI|nr:Zn-dependent exopeptidase [Phialemonium atrogriseum]KAK1768195.1 Zn-dependent exopeptidase [Phialemonium atrogriseum]